MIIQKKVCLLGDFAVGKTSLVRRFVEGRFDDKYLSTVGVKISRKSLARDGHQLNLLIWDLAGGEEFMRYETSYLRGATGALIVCDLTRPETLAKAQQYAAEMRRVNPAAACVLVANKVDLTGLRAITDQELRAASALLNAPYLVTSAKSGANVPAAFDHLADAVAV
jgi:small GTP-binding protein